MTCEATTHPQHDQNEGNSLFLASSSIVLNKLRHFCTLETPLNLSAHDPIMATITIANEASPSSIYSETYTKFNRKKIIWDDKNISKYQELAAQALCGASTRFDTPESLPLLSSLFSELLVQCANMAFKSKPAVSTTKHPKSSPRIQKAEELLKSTFHSWKNAGKPPSHNHPSRTKYLNARSNLQRLKRYENNLKEIRNNNFLMRAAIKDKNQVYNYMKQD